jgi:ribosomal protein S18 acetylase RimI-like enzyme
MLNIINRITITDLAPKDLFRCDWDDEGPTPFALETMVARSLNDWTVRVLAGYMDDGTVAVVGAIDFLTPYCPEICMVATKPSERKKGYATRLLQALEAEAVRRGVPAVKLSVEPTNLTARHLYSTIGYTYQDTNMEGHWHINDLGEPMWTSEPVLIMKKAL